MINHNFTNMVMALVKYLNTNRKMKGKTYLEKDGLDAVEKRIIGIVNFYNKIVNFFVNNRLALYLNDLRANLFGSGYSEYLYNDETKEYIVRVIESYGTKNWIVRQIKLLFNVEHVEAEVSTTPSHEYALDISKNSFWRKKHLMTFVNKAWAFNGNGKFRIKRIAEYSKSKVLDDEVLCSKGYDTNDGIGDH